MVLVFTSRCALAMSCSTAERGCGPRYPQIRQIPDAGEESPPGVGVHLLSAHDYELDVGTMLEIGCQPDEQLGLLGAA